MSSQLSGNYIEPIGFIFYFGDINTLNAKIHFLGLEQMGLAGSFSSPQGSCHSLHQNEPCGQINQWLFKRLCCCHSLKCFCVCQTLCDVFGLITKVEQFTVVVPENYYTAMRILAHIQEIRWPNRIKSIP